MLAMARHLSPRRDFWQPFLQKLKQQQPGYCRLQQVSTVPMVYRVVFSRYSIPIDTTRSTHSTHSLTQPQNYRKIPSHETRTRFPVCDTRIPSLFLENTRVRTQVLSSGAFLDLRFFSWFSLLVYGGSERYELRKEIREKTHEVFTSLFRAVECGERGQGCSRLCVIQWSTF